MRRLLLLCEYATLNGGERSMLSTLEGVRRAGFDISVACPANGPLAEVLVGQGVERLPFETHDPDGIRIPLDRLRERLADSIRRMKPRLIHANSLAMGRIAGPVAKGARTPSISHMRDILKLSRQAVADLNDHTRMLAVSAVTRAFHVGQGLDPEKTHVLHNGVDLQVFRPAGFSGFLHRELGLPDDVPLIGAIGQISLRKGFDALFHAFERSTARSGARLLIVGERNSDKEESRQFETRLRETAAGGLADRVHFLGRRNDVARILNELTLLVHPARQEPLGRVLLEAAAAGVPIIATRAGGTIEIFPSECESARLVDVDDSIGMARAIDELLADESARKLLAAAARRRMEACFDHRDATAALVKHYEEIVAVPIKSAERDLL